MPYDQAQVLIAQARLEADNPSFKVGKELSPSITGRVGRKSRWIEVAQAGNLAALLLFMREFADMFLSSMIQAYFPL